MVKGHVYRNGLTELQSVCLPITEQHKFSEAIQDIFMRSCVGTGGIILQLLYTPEADESVGCSVRGPLSLPRELRSD